MADGPIAKCALRPFLAKNPFPHPFTDGLFYREKMRAIHRTAPTVIGERGRPATVLEIGGGRSGVGARLFPGAAVTNCDIDPVFEADAARSGTTFVCGDACDLPFPDASFDAVTMFDVLEHIADDAKAARQARRVVRPGGVILVSCPDADWRYPHHDFLRSIAGDEAALMAEWGHVRRGYTPDDLTRLFDGPADARASFINPRSAIYHDIAFSRLGRWRKSAGYALAAPVAAFGYLTDRGTGKGAETAYRWQA